MNHELAIIGAGNMAEAIARGLIRARVISADRIIAADVCPQRRELFTRELSIEATDSAARAASAAAVILLCVKPQNIKEVLASMGPALRDDALVISIAAGISTNFIEEALAPKSARIIRTMPNTPMLVGQGVVAVAPGSRATELDIQTTRRLFAPAAWVIEVAEETLDAVTALSGSGPAYFFYLVEQMIAAGVEMGLSQQDAHTLATRTALGAATMLTACEDSPQELRRKVTSPGGVTHAAITHMQQHNFARIVADALKAAQSRSRELGSQAKEQHS